MPLVRLVAEETFSWQKPVIDKDLISPPAAVNGDRYIVGAGATGAWAGQAGKVAWYYAAAWYFDTPIAGWIAWVADEAKYYNYTTSWAAAWNYEKHTVTAGEAGTGIIDMIGGNTYTVSNNSLMVFLNGQLQTITDDYTETDSDTVTFAAGRIAENDIIIFRQ